MSNMVLTLAGKCAFCHAAGEYIEAEGIYGWRHKHPVCELFKGALSQAKNVKSLEDGDGWKIVSSQKEET